MKRIVLPVATRLAIMLAVGGVFVFLPIPKPLAKWSTGAFTPCRKRIAALRHA